MDYKLLVIDIDGTLLSRDGSISVENREALARVRQSGIGVSLSTGRAAQGSLSIINQLSLDGYHMFFDGALLSDPGRGEEIYVQPLDSAAVGQAVQFARQSDIYLELYSTSHYFVEHETWATEIHHKFFNLEPTVGDFGRLWERERLVKGGMVTSSPQEAAKATSFQRQFNGSFHFSWAKSPAYPEVDFINIVASGVSKGKTLEILTSHLGISPGEVMAVGDGTNDLSLFGVAGLAIAMGNAPDEVKAVADGVTLDVDRGGLAAAIERFLL